MLMTLRQSERAHVCQMFPQLLLWIIVIFDRSSVLPLILSLGWREFPSNTGPSHSRTKLNEVSFSIHITLLAYLLTQICNVPEWLFCLAGFIWGLGVGGMKSLSAAQLGVSLSFPFPPLFVFFFLIIFDYLLSEFKSRLIITEMIAATCLYGLQTLSPCTGNNVKAQKAGHYAPIITFSLVKLKR